MAEARLLTALVCLAAAVVLAQAQCTGSVNNHSIWSQVVPILYRLTLQAPRFVSQVKNGLLYTADAQTNNSLPIAHLYGSAYEMGYAHGQLLRTDIINFYKDFEKAIDQIIAPYVKNLPQVL
jgi:isopenicillin-N N-acyltransferase-like protein